MEYQMHDPPKKILIDKTSSKLKTLSFPVNDTVKRIKKQSTDWEKYL